MPFDYTCPHCGIRTRIADEFAGQSGPCSGCGRMITVPPTAPPPGPAAPKRANVSLVVILIALVAAVPIMLACAGILIALLLPAFSISREAARRTACANNLRQIGLALQNYHSAHGCFPPAFLADDEGRPMHSWRVLILPYLDHKWLYDQYDFDEPWDGPANLALADLMPDVYRCPSDIGPGDAPETSYAMVVGPGTISDGPTPSRISQIRDGLAGTLMVVEVAGSHINWLEPRDCRIEELASPGADGEGPGICSGHPDVVNVLFCDGSVRAISDWLDPEVVQALSTIAGGEEVAVPGGL